MTTATAFSLARRLRAGETVHSGWCGLSSPIVAELVGREGFPAVTLDGQHGLWDTASIVSGVAQVRQSGAAAIVRIPVGEFATASRALDFGAEADAYAKAVVMADFEEIGDDDVFRKLRNDFDAKGVKETDHQIRRTMDELMAKAVQEIKAGS